MSSICLNKQIFPKSITEIDNLIICFSDGKSLCQLQLVNKAALNVLKNEGFGSIFKFKYPDLFNDDFPLRFLVTLRPDICWKFAAYAMEVSDMGAFLSHCLTDRFLFAGFPHLCESWKREIGSFEERRKEICGSIYEDPNSPIDQAWKLSQICNKASNEMKELVGQLESALGQIHTGLEVEAIKTELFQFLEFHPIFSEKNAFEHWIDHLENRRGEELGFLQRKYIAEHKCIFKSYIEQYLDLHKRSVEGKKKYNELECERQSIKSKTLYLSFLIRKHEDICGFLEVEKQQQEEELEGICGTGPYDPNSVIHEAWASAVTASATTFVKPFFSPKILASPPAALTPGEFGTPVSFNSPASQSASGIATPEAGSTETSSPLNLAIYRMLEGKRVETLMQLTSTKNELLRFQNLKEGIDVKSHESSEHLDPYREQLATDLKKAKEMADDGEQKDS